MSLQKQINSEPDWVTARRNEAKALLGIMQYPHSRYTQIPDLMSMIPEKAADSKIKAENAEVIPLSELPESRIQKFQFKIPENKIEAVVESFWTSGCYILVSGKQAH